MAPSKHSSVEKDWILRRPLQIESLRQELPESEEIERILRELQHRRENLDAVVFALSSQRLAMDRREHLLEILRRQQRALEECFKELGVTFRVQGKAPLWYFNQLDPLARAHLSAILGVPEEPPFFEVLDIKAEEYMAQLTAFDALANRYGFRECDSFQRRAKRSIIILTLSGSLIQLSEPISPKYIRRYLYQNIYGNTHPPEGVLVLDRDIKLGHRIHSVELTTSPVRAMRVVNRKLSWKVQSLTFERISQTLSSLTSQTLGQLIASGKSIELEQEEPLHLKRKRAAERVFEQEYGKALEQFNELRKQFIEGDTKDALKIDAELLTLCHYLQTGARELGFDARNLEEVVEFQTQDEHLYRIDPQAPGRISQFPRGNGPEVIFLDVSVGKQIISIHAPLAFIGKSGALVEVTAPITSMVHRKSRK